MLGLGDGPGGVDESDVAEGLGEVAEQLTGGRVDFLGQEADIVGVGDGTLEDAPCPLRLVGQGQGLGSATYPSATLPRVTRTSIEPHNRPAIKID